jgi:hypothetical protein
MDASKFKTFYKDCEAVEVSCDCDTLKEAHEDCESFGSDTEVFIYKLVKSGKVTSQVEWK